MAGIPTFGHHWNIAISYAREDRARVAPIADLLARRLSMEKVLYDVYHGWDFARDGLDDLFRDFYRRSSDLVVVFLSKHYPSKPWCRQEMAAIHERRQEKDPQSIMCLSLDSHSDYSAIAFDDLKTGKNPVAKETAETISQEIFRRWDSIVGRGPDYTPFRIGHISDPHFRFDDAIGATDQHDPSMLRGLTALFGNQLNCMVVSGDVTSRGDSNSFERSSHWFRALTDLDAARSGLTLRDRGIPLIVVPGNADFHRDRVDTRLHPSGIDEAVWPAIPKGIQGLSLERFKRWYSDRDAGEGTGVRWFRHAPDNYVVIYRMLTPPTRERWLQGRSMVLSAKAGDELFKVQIEAMQQQHRELLKNGSSGSAECPVITKEHYARSAKIVVMHHPLDPLNGDPRRRSRRIERRIRALAAVGVHAILCGHQHCGAMAMVKLATSRVPAADRDQRDTASLNQSSDPSAAATSKGKYQSKFTFRKLVLSWGLVEREWTEEIAEKRDRSISQLIRRPGWIDGADSIVDQIAEALVTRFLENIATDSRPPTEQSRMRLQAELDSLTKAEIDLMRRVAEHPKVKQLERRLHTWQLAQFRSGSSAKTIGPVSSSKKLDRVAGVLKVQFSAHKVHLDYEQYAWHETQRQFHGPDYVMQVVLDR